MVVLICVGVIVGAVGVNETRVLRNIPLTTSGPVLNAGIGWRDAIGYLFAILASVSPYNAVGCCPLWCCCG